MKQKRFSLTWIALVITLLGTTLAADENDDKRGRFFRRMRKEFSASKNPAPKKTRKKNAQDKGKTPTLADQPKSKGKPAGKSNSQKAAAGVQRSNMKTTLGLGMLIELRHEELTVKTLDRHGNAASAGIKTGDKITGVGGVEIGSLDEFNDITKILGNGDQLEFQIARKGKPKTMLIQFGVAPKEGVITTLQDVSAPDVVDLKPSLQGSTVTPAASANGLHSVLSLPQYQRQQIEQLQSEIRRLRQQPSALPATAGHTILRNPGR